MLKAPAMSDSVMRLTFSVLQNRPFGFLKRRVLASETGHIATTIWAVSRSGVRHQESHGAAGRLCLHIRNGDYIRNYPNFRHGKTYGHGNAVGLTFRRNKLERR